MSYQKGKWLVLCDVCGFQYHNTQLRKRWDGMMVCKQDFETRHPQEFIHAVMERDAAWIRPEGTHPNVSPFLYVDVGYWDRPSIVPPADYAEQDYTGDS